MKRKGMILLAIVLVIAVGVVLAAQNTPAQKNKRILASLMDDFSDTVSQYSQEKIIETERVYGKLNGNGNGIAFFGAALVKKSAVTDMDGLLAQLDKEYENVGAVEQKGQKVESKYLEHRSLTYDTPVPDDGGYITVYFYTSHPDSDLRDPAGH